MSTIGRAAPVAQSGPLQLSGLIASLVWLDLHIAPLIGSETRLLLLIL